ncbi:MAG TPA: hypothetical protein VHM26_10315 [Chitinophagaceae bacterium]|jgi:hypothetical protein|nr:hypothetical protein [Chitinophagaceae bacterium]
MKVFVTTLLAITTMILLAVNSSAQVAIGTNGASSHPSAMLDIQSTNKGFLPPRMNYESILSISNPATGLQVYDSTYNCIRYYNGAYWVRLVTEVKDPAGFYGESAIYADGSGQPVYINDICSDGEGNIYTTGFFQGTAKFGSTTFTSTSGPDGFIVKYDKNGAVVWARQTTGAGDDVFKSIAWANGNVFVIGEFNGNINIGNTNLVCTNQQAISIAKFDASGNKVWAQSMNGPGVNKPDAVTASPAGNLYVSCRYVGTSLTVAPGFVLGNSGGSYDAFVAKFNSSGVAQWVKPVAGTQDDKVLDIVWYNNTIAGTGYFESPSLVMNAFTLTNPGNYGQLLAFKLDENGQTTWAQHYGIAGTHESGKAITADATGALYIAGEYELGNTVIGSSSLSNAGYADGMLVRISPTNTAEAFALRSPSKETVTGVALVGSYVYISVHSTSPSSFTIANKTFPTVNRGGEEVFIARLISSIPSFENYQQLQQFGGISHDYTYAMCSDPALKNVFCVGRSELAPVVFSPNMLYNIGPFIWRYTGE